ELKFDARGRIDSRHLGRSFENGLSLHLRDLDHRWPPVINLREQLRADFAERGFPLTNAGTTIAFLTPSRSCALNPHIDLEDLFVLQIDGRKRWRFFDDQPQNEFDRSWESETPPVSLETEVRAGDLLYIPRGFIHQAETGDEHSLAVTMGFRPVGWADVVLRVLKGCIHQVEAARETVAPRHWSEGRLSEEGEAHLRALLRDLPDRPVWKDAVRELRCETIHPPDHLTNVLRASDQGRKKTTDDDEG
ncbi:MAG: cupin domain-containing protein, partial [Planctomycetales bacterium]